MRHFSMCRKSLVLYILPLVLFSCGQSNSSNGESFTLNNSVVAAPNTPSLPYLWDFSTGEDCIVRVRWMDNSDSEDRFIVQRSLYHNYNMLPEVSNLTYDSSEQEKTGMGMRHFFDALPSSSVFVEYKIRAENRTGFSAWSPFAGIELNNCIP
ncbi:MAG TPA: hypothetical protein PKC21_08805 [Oligoflexia bacterium]|nr:hypothetical protein [Oligoflexia bacterium]HMR25438.1 hypothetical protein [Oligoflexia bacterium]